MRTRGRSDGDHQDASVGGDATPGGLPVHVAAAARAWRRISWGDESRRRARLLGALAGMTSGTVCANAGTAHETTSKSGQKLAYAAIPLLDLMD
jgi:hypothetical protein